nr:MAG TPA: hypothetical protein [Caudoviricetes sp.]
MVCLFYCQAMTFKRANLDLDRSFKLSAAVEDTTFKNVAVRRITWIF